MIFPTKNVLVTLRLKPFLLCLLLSNELHSILVRGVKFKASIRFVNLQFSICFIDFGLSHSTEYHVYILKSSWYATL